MKSLLAGLAMALFTFSSAALADDALTPGPVVGIGVAIHEIDSQPTIEQVVPGQAAYKHGMKVGDRILKIDGKSVAGLDLKHVAAKLRGAAKSKVTVTIQRPGETGTRIFSLRRQIVTLTSPNENDSPVPQQ